jgi:hypothetical protein
MVALLAVNFIKISFPLNICIMRMVCRYINVKDIIFLLLLNCIIIYLIVYISNLDLKRRVPIFINILIKNRNLKYEKAI